MIRARTVFIVLRLVGTLYSLYTRVPDILEGSVPEIAVSEAIPV